ncbi:MAG TPA: phage Gp37/Gp68 family protein [Methylomirabilota bacterium]|nr:phage Gp37/Gp68 family protein [Methylomirabilota bacterium]
MSDGSPIEWTDATWNPTTGCTKVSQGCKHCYAETLAKRLQAMGSANYRNGFRLTLQPQMLPLPLKWKGRRRIFVNSMSDLFHQLVPDTYLDQVFDVMDEASWHIFQVLTKRPQRMAEYIARRYGASGAPAQIWVGTSIEDQRVAARLVDLARTPAATRFLSCEPLIGPLIDLDLSGIHWVIVGGESGGGHRPMSAAWVRQIRRQCRAAGVAFFFKQWGGVNPTSGGRLLDGREYNEMPRSARSTGRRAARLA